jgi:hypothetical protein
VTRRCLDCRRPIRTNRIRPMEGPVRCGPCQKAFESVVGWRCGVSHPEIEARIERYAKRVARGEPLFGRR